jgi:hypothetical protein
MSRDSAVRRFGRALTFLLQELLLLIPEVEEQTDTGSDENRGSFWREYLHNRRLSPDLFRGNVYSLRRPPYPFHLLPVEADS